MSPLADGREYLFVLGFGGLLGAAVLLVALALGYGWRLLELLQEAVTDPEPPEGVPLLHGDDEGGAAA